MADQVKQVSEEQTTQNGDKLSTTRTTATNRSNGGVNKIKQVVWFLFGVLITLLLIRFVLSLFGANEANAFADFIYASTAPFVAPFRGLFNVQEAVSGVRVFEGETLVAVAVYALLGWGIAAALSLFKKN